MAPAAHLPDLSLSDLIQIYTITINDSIKLSGEQDKAMNALHTYVYGPGKMQPDPCENY